MGASTLGACSHIVHQRRTQRGAKSCNTILEGSSLIICPTRSLYISFINCRSLIKTIIFQYTRLYIEIVKAKILIGQRLWGIDSWFSYRGVQSQSPINSSYIAPLPCITMFVLPLTCLTSTSITCITTYTTLLLCIGLSESDSKLHTNFEFCEGKYHKHLKSVLIYKVKQFMMTNNQKKK